MRIYIDVSVLTLATFITGIQRVTREITLRLIDDPRLEVILLHYNAKEDRYYRIDNDRFVSFYREGRGIKNRMITRKIVPLEEIGSGCVFFDLDAAWMSRVNRSYLLPILKKQGARIIPHIYDIISITHPQYCLQRGVYHFMDYLGAHLQYADEIIVNAQATVTQLENLTERIGVSLPPCHVVPLGADFKGAKQKNGAVQMTADLPQTVMDAVGAGPYILMVGTVEPRKNHKLLLEAYEKGLKQAGYNLIIAGYMGWNMESFAQKLQAHPDFGTRIYHLEGLKDNAIAYLYQNARFLAFCSYTEGFGLPLIESIVRGTPVVAADIPVSREVAGEYCLWFEQDNARELCQRILAYHDQEEAYAALQQKLTTYQVPTWKDCYEQMANELLGDGAKGSF